MNITELKARKGKAWDECKAFLESHRNENGCLSAEDEATYNNMVAIVDNMDKEIKRAEDVEARDAAMAAPTSKPLTSGISTSTGKEGRASDEYEKEFINYLKTRRASNALQEDTNSEGGYLVPVEFERTLFKARDKVDPIFALAGKINLGSNVKNVPYVASEGAAALVAEEGTYGDTDDSFGQVVFHAYKFGRICKVSDELIADSAFDILGHLAESFGRAIGKAEAGYFWTGTGSSQPQGVLTAAGSGVTAAATNAITADEIIDLFFSLDEQYRENASFVMNNATLAVVRKLKTSGSGEYIWAQGFNGQPSTLLGRPVYTSSNIPTIAAGKKVIAFGDFEAGYKIGDRSGFNLKILNELYAANGQVGVRGDGRTDGKGILASSAIKVLTMKAS